MQDLALSGLTHAVGWQHVAGTQSASDVQASWPRTSSAAVAPGASEADATAAAVELSGAGRTASGVDVPQAESRKSAGNVERERG